MSTDGAPIETDPKKSKGKTSSPAPPAGRAKGRARGTRRGRQSADAAKSGENLDDEGLIKTVQKKGKKKEEGTLEETIGTEMERVMRASQFGWSRVPCIRARHLQSKSFTVQAYDKLQRNISKAGVQHLYEKAKDPAQGLLTTVTDHALDIIVDRALVDPASFTSDPSKLTDILRPVLGLEPSLAIAFLLAGHHRLEALKRYWLELANAADEASITWTDKTRKLLDTRGTWLVRLWDKQRLESSVWGPAIIQKLRSNDLTAQRPDTPARKAATLAASIDTRNVDAIRAAMFTTLHINKAKDAFHNVMGNFCAARNLLVDMVKDPAYVKTSKLIETFFDPVVWQIVGECWGEPIGYGGTTSKDISKILANASPEIAFYRERVNPDDEDSISANNQAFRHVYTQNNAGSNALEYRMTPEERVLYNLLTAASETAIREVPTMLEQFKKMVVRGILTGWREYPCDPDAETDPCEDYYNALTDAFDLALDAHNADKNKPQIQHPELVKNAVYNIAYTTLEDDDGVGPLRWTTRLPLLCPSVLSAVMDAFSKGERIKDASVILKFFVNLLAPASLRISDQLRPKDERYDQGAYTPVRMLTLWLYNMGERQRRGTQMTRQERAELTQKAEVLALRIADLALAYHRLLSVEAVARMAKINSYFDKVLPFKYALVGAVDSDDESTKPKKKPKKSAAIVDDRADDNAADSTAAHATDAKKPVDTGTELWRNSVMVVHLSAITKAWGNRIFKKYGEKAIRYYPFFTTEMETAYVTTAQAELPSITPEQAQIVLLAARLLPHFPVDPFVAPDGTGSGNRTNNERKTMVPAAIQYALHAREIVNAVFGIKSVETMLSQISALVCNQLLGEDWTPWVMDSVIGYPLRSSDSWTISDNATLETAKEIPIELTIRAANKANRVKAAGEVVLGLVREMVVRGGKALQEYQEGNKKNEYTLTEDMVKLLRPVIKQLFIDVYEAHGGTKYTTQEEIDAKIAEADRLFMSHVKIVTPEQLKAIQEKLLAPVPDVEKVTKKKGESSKGDVDGSDEEAVSAGVKRKASTKKGGAAKKAKKTSD